MPVDSNPGFPATAPAADLLFALHRVFPHYGSSFYAKAKLVKRTPPPSPPTIVIDLIQQCSLGCAFCFAADTRRRGAFLEDPALDALLEAARGVARIVVVGGEPFEHPGIEGVLERLCRTVTDEVEVFTNGAAIPEDPDAALAWAGRLASRASGRALRLTLAADPWHRDRLGADRFEAAVQALIAAEAVPGIHAMFNVTDRRLDSEDYLDLPVIREVLNALSPVLWERFRRLLPGGRIDDSFYMNPLVIQGSQGECEDAERLRSVDFLFHPEVVATPRDGRLLVVGALNAAWMSDPPPALILGHLPERELADVILTDVAGRALDFPSAAWLRPAFVALASGRVDRPALLADARALHEAHGSTDPLLEPLLACLAAGDDDGAAQCFEASIRFADLARFGRDPDAWFGALANRLLEFADRAPAGLSIDLSGRRDFDKIRLPVLQQALVRLADRRETDVYQAPVSLWGRLAAGGGQEVPVLLATEQTIGRLPEPSLLVLPLTGTAIDTGFGAWPTDAPYLVRPGLRVGPQGAVHAGIVGVTTRSLPGGADRAESEARRLLEYLDLLFGPLALALRSRLHGLVDDPWGRRLDALLARPPNDSIATEAMPLLADPGTVFEYVTFDPNRNAPAFHNKVLLASIFDRLDLGRYDVGRTTRFRAALSFWRGVPK